jgi:hypothetical protein
MENQGCTTEEVFSSVCEKNGHMTHSHQKLKKNTMEFPTEWKNSCCLCYPKSVFDGYWHQNVFDGCMTLAHCARVSRYTIQYGGA